MGGLDKSEIPVIRIYTYESKSELIVQLLMWKVKAVSGFPFFLTRNSL